MSGEDVRLDPLRRANHDERAEAIAALRTMADLVEADPEARLVGSIELKRYGPLRTTTINLNL